MKLLSFIDSIASYLPAIDKLQHSFIGTYLAIIALALNGVWGLPLIFIIIIPSLLSITKEIIWDYYSVSPFNFSDLVYSILPGILLYFSLYL